MSKFMQVAINESIKSYKNGDVPVGAIIVQNDKILAKGYNKKEKNKNAILHAEIIAIDKACRKNGDWHLEDCTLYTTMEPCMMCCGAIVQARIKKIVYLLDNENFGGKKYLENSKIEFVKEVNDYKMKQILSDFFKEKRNK